MKDTTYYLIIFGTLIFLVGIITLVALNLEIDKEIKTSCFESNKTYIQYNDNDNYIHITFCGNLIDFKSIIGDKLK